MIFQVYFFSKGSDIFDTECVISDAFDLTTLNSVYNDYVYNDIPVIAIEFHGPGHDASK